VKQPVSFVLLCFPQYETGVRRVRRTSRIEGRALVKAMVELRRETTGFRSECKNVIYQCTHSHGQYYVYLLSMGRGKQ
jgi:hypothetical protein